MHSSFHCFLIRVYGALLGVLALYSGFTTEMIVVVIFATFYACWRVSSHTGTLLGSKKVYNAPIHNSYVVIGCLYKDLSVHVWL